MKMKIGINMVGLLCLAACTGTNSEWRQNITPNSNYKINPVKIEMISKCAATHFKTAQQLQDDFTAAIKKEFCANNKCVDVIAPDTIVVDTNIKYSRTFMGEAVACSESYAASSVIYSFDLSKNGDIFYTRSQSPSLVPARGFFNNLGRIATQLTFSGSPEQEKADLEYLTAGVAKQILKDLQ